jgi:hypothetical protein
MFSGIEAASTAYSQEHTSTKLAAQAPSKAAVSAICTRSPDVLKVVPIAGKNIGRF